MSKGNRRPGKVYWLQGTVFHPALPTLPYVFEGEAGTEKDLVPHT